MTQVVLVVLPKTAKTVRITAKVVAGAVADPVAANNAAKLTLTVLHAAKH